MFTFDAMEVGAALLATQVSNLASARDCQTPAHAEGHFDGQQADVPDIDSQCVRLSCGLMKQTLSHVGNIKTLTESSKHGQDAKLQMFNLSSLQVLLTRYDPGMRGLA